MSLKIINVMDATSNEWDTFWNSSTSATYYHSRQWAEIWQLYSNGIIKPEPKKVAFSDGVSVLLPFSKQSYYGGIIKRYSLAGPPAMALPYYGNWLTYDLLTEEHVSLLTNYILNNFRNLVWRLNPYDSNSGKIIASSKYAVRNSLVTYMIDLTKGEDYILSNMNQSCRNQVKQGIRNKLTVTEGEDINDWEKYYNIYRDTLKRWGSKTIYMLDWKIFHILFHAKDSRIKLWLVWHNEIVIAGGICFYSQGKIISWHIASLTEYHKLRPINFLKYMIIKDGINKNYHWFDFETAGGKKGLRRFKKSFGPEEKMCDMIIKWHPVIYYTKKIFDSK